MKRAGIKTKKKDIIDYWARNINEDELSIDFSEADERCWRCGCEKNLERAHIVPASLGGEDIPSNFVLLCKRCHLENPNVTNSEIMWDWLKAYRVPLYNTFWYIQGYEEYKKIYGKDFFNELKERNIDDKKYKELVYSLYGDVTYHFGAPYLNTATIVGIMRMAIKKYDNENS